MVQGIKVDFNYCYQLYLIVVLIVYLKCMLVIMIDSPFSPR